MKSQILKTIDTTTGCKLKLVRKGKEFQVQEGRRVLDRRETLAAANKIFKTYARVLAR